jgi:hypothetical protein
LTGGQGVTVVTQGQLSGRATALDDQQQQAHSEQQQPASAVAIERLCQTVQPFAVERVIHLLSFGAIR